MKHFKKTDASGEQVKQRMKRRLRIEDQVLVLLCSSLSLEEKEILHQVSLTSPNLVAVSAVPLDSL